MKIEQVQFRGAACVRLEVAGARVLVALQGAQVLSWQTPDGRERLFLGERARLDGGAAIRGGIPVIFPQFGARGRLAKHGFARLRRWRFVGEVAGAARFELACDGTDTDWPHACAVRLGIRPGAMRLRLDLEVENTGASALAFSAALHGYLRVDALASAQLFGLTRQRYEDSASGGDVRLDAAPTLRFDGEVDRIYVAPAQALELREGARGLRLSQAGFGEVVVWNPGATLAAGIGDLAPGEHSRFVCIEAAQVLAPVSLGAGARWCGWQAIEAVPASG